MIPLSCGHDQGHLYGATDVCALCFLQSVVRYLYIVYIMPFPGNCVLC